MGTAGLRHMTAHEVTDRAATGHRRDGAGARLVEAFLAWAAEQGAGHTEVTAYTDNTDALRFYARRGFAPRLVTLRRSF